MAIDFGTTKHDALVRKATDGIVLIAPMTATIPTVLTDGTGELTALPTGYTSLGWLNSDSGASFSKETEVSDVMGLGSTSPIRQDVTSNVTTLTVSALELNATTLGLYSNVDLSAVEADANGSVSFTEAVRPETNYYRVLVLFQDGRAGQEIYFARVFAKAAVTEVGEFTASADDPLALELTFTSYVDSEAGFAVKHYLEGPGWNELVEDAGFTRATGGEG